MRSCELNPALRPLPIQNLGRSLGVVPKPVGDRRDVGERVSFKPIREITRRAPEPEMHSPIRRVSKKLTSPRHHETNAERGERIVSSGKPGLVTQTDTSVRLRSMKRDLRLSTSKRTTIGTLGSASNRTRRCMSTSNGPRSLSSPAAERGSHLWPQVPNAPMIEASSLPASVSRYSGPRLLSIFDSAPTKISSCNRSESIVREIRGMPRRMSLKRTLPHRISRTMSRVQRPPRTS